MIRIARIAPLLIALFCLATDAGAHTRSESYSHWYESGTTISTKDPSPTMLKDIVSRALRQGCWGIKMLGGYHPFTPETTSGIIRECNQQLAYIAFHIGTRESGSHIGGVREIPELVGNGLSRALLTALSAKARA